MDKEQKARLLKLLEFAEAEDLASKVFTFAVVLEEIIMAFPEH